MFSFKVIISTLKRLTKMSLLHVLIQTERSFTNKQSETEQQQLVLEKQVLTGILTTETHLRFRAYSVTKNSRPWR